MTRRRDIIETVETALNQISVANGYQVDFDEITRWQDLPTEYNKNHLNFADEEEDYKPENTKYDAKLDLAIEAVVVETDLNADYRGTLALEDLICAVNSMRLNGALFDIHKSSKFVETKGKTACYVRLIVKVLYHFDR